jgi:hypothetical protein
VNTAIALLAAMVATSAVRALIEALPPARRGRRRRRPATTTVDPADLGRIDRAVTSGTASAGDLHLRLRPILREVAIDGLRRHGVELDAQPARAQELLAPATWELVRPDRPPPTDAFARGLAAAQLDSVLDDLEALMS